MKRGRKRIPRENRTCDNPNCYRGFRAPRNSKKRYCSKKCAQSDPETKARILESRYGAERVRKSAIHSEPEQYYFIIDSEHGDIHRRRTADEAQLAVDRFIAADNDARNLVIIKGERLSLEKKLVIS